MLFAVLLRSREAVEDDSSDWDRLDRFNNGGSDESELESPLGSDLERALGRSPISEVAGDTLASSLALSLTSSRDGHSLAVFTFSMLDSSGFLFPGGDSRNIFTSR